MQFSAFSESSSRTIEPKVAVKIYCFEKVFFWKRSAFTLKLIGQCRANQTSSARPVMGLKKRINWQILNIMHLETSDVDIINHQIVINTI